MNKLIVFFGGEFFRLLGWGKLYFSKFLAVVFSGAELSVAPVGIKDEGGDLPR